MGDGCKSWFLLLRCCKVDSLIDDWLMTEATQEARPWKRILKLKFNSGQLIPVYLPSPALESTFWFLLSRLDTDLLSRSNCQIVNVTRISTKIQLIMVPRASSSTSTPNILFRSSFLPDKNEKRDFFVTICWGNDPAMEAKLGVVLLY